MGHYAAEMGERRPLPASKMTSKEQNAWRAEAFAAITAAREIEAAIGIKLSCSDQRVCDYLTEMRRRQPELRQLEKALSVAARRIRTETLQSIFGRSDKA